MVARARTRTPRPPLADQEILLGRHGLGDRYPGKSWEMASDGSVSSLGEEVPDVAETTQRLKAVLRDPGHLTELRLVLLGWRWPGKSLTGNTILGREEFRLERAADFCVKRETTVDRRQVTVVDTPGWFSSQATPDTYRQEMVRAPSLCPPGPHAFLLVIPVGMFTETDRLRVEENLALLGEQVWRHTILVFTLGPGLRDMPIERHIHREGRDLQRLVERCHKRYHVINNQVFGEHPQLPLLFEKIDKMVDEEGGFYVAQERPAQVATEGHDLNVDGRDLGARPKQNGSAALIRSLQTDPSQNVGEKGENRVGAN